MNRVLLVDGKNINDDPTNSVRVVVFNSEDETLGIFDRIRGASGPRREEVLEQLTKVHDPELQKDIVALGYIKKLEIKGGEVALTVELNTSATPARKQVKEACEKFVHQLPTVSKVHVTMTAREVAPSPPSGEGHPTEHPALAQVRHIIAVASGKGGVGKSSTAVNIAFSLAASGAKVGLLDADVYGPSVPQMTGVGQPTEMEGDLVRPPEKDGVKVISGEMFAQKGQAQMLRGPLVAQIVRQFLTHVAWGELDYLIIDYPPGTGDIQLTLSQVATITGAIVVTTPQEVALRDVRKAIHMFETLKVPLLGIVETMSYFVCDGCEKKHFLFPRGGGHRLAEEYDVSLLAEVPMDPRIAETADRGEQIVNRYPESIGAVALKSASEGLVRELAKAKAQVEGALSQYRLEWK